jgi:type IV secretion system protein VirD4
MVFLVSLKNGYKNKKFNFNDVKIFFFIVVIIIPIVVFLFTPYYTNLTFSVAIELILSSIFYFLPTLILIGYRKSEYEEGMLLFLKNDFKFDFSNQSFNDSESFWSGTKIIFSVIFSYIILSTVSDSFFSDSNTSSFNILTFVETIFAEAILVLLGYLLWNKLSKEKNPKVNKKKEDLLANDDAVIKIKSLLDHKEEGVWCGRVRGIDLYASIEDRAVVIGPPGTGKTAFMVTQLIGWIKSGRSFVSLDIKPEIFGILRFELEEKGYKVITFNPTSQTGQRYNFITDLDSPEAVGELAGYLIPADDGSNSVFFESARDFLDSILSHLKATLSEPTLPDVRDFVTEYDKYEDLLKTLKNSPDNDARELANGLALTANNERLLGSIFATFRANLRFLRYPAIRDSLSASEFSLSELGREKPVALFLQFEEKNKGITEKLLVTFINHMFRYFISHTARNEILILLDELGNAPRIDGLVEKLNTIRSRHLPTWMYFQSIEQMQMYGNVSGEGANKILGACDYQQVFRLNDNSSAEMMSKAIGVVDREVSSRNVSTSVGFFDSVESVTESKNLVQEPIIFPHELRQLKKNETITIYQGLAWRGEATPYFKAYPEYQGIKPAEHEIVGKAYT